MPDVPLNEIVAASVPVPSTIVAFDTKPVLDDVPRSTVETVSLDGSDVRLVEYSMSPTVDTCATAGAAAAHSHSAANGRIVHRAPISIVCLHRMGMPVSFILRYVAICEWPSRGRRHKRKRRASSLGQWRAGRYSAMT